MFKKSVTKQPPELSFGIYFLYSTTGPIVLKGSIFGRKGLVFLSNWFVLNVLSPELYVFSNGTAEEQYLYIKA